MQFTTKIQVTKPKNDKKKNFNIIIESENFLNVICKLSQTLGQFKGGERISETERVYYFERNAGGKPLHKSVVTVVRSGRPGSPIELNI